MLEGWPPSSSNSAQQAKRDDPWSEAAQTEGRSCSFFIGDPMKQHLDVLRLSPLGRSLVNFISKRGVKIIENRELPKKTEAVYKRPPNRFRAGVIEHGKRVHATLMGHEIRHVWQHLAEPTKTLIPRSAEEEILLGRAFEADARAVEFVVTVQCVAALGSTHPYARNLIACLDHYEKEICLFSSRELDRLAHHKQDLNQATRRVFDRWMTFSPAQETYDTEIEKYLKWARADGLSRTWGRLFNLGADPYPKYTHTGVRDEFAAKLAGVLGDQLVPGMGNYLTETKGPPLTDPVYTRICNYRLERWAKHHSSQLRA